MDLETGPQLQACGGTVAPHACQLRQAEASLGEQCPRLPRCLQALYPHGTAALIRFTLSLDGVARLPFGTAQAIQELYNVPFDEVNADPAPLFAMVHPDDFECMTERLVAAARGLHPWVDTCRIAPRGGVTQRWLGVCMVPYRKNDQQLVGYGLICDVTSTVDAIQAMREVAGGASVGLFRLDRDGRLLAANRHAAEILGLPSVEALLAKMQGWDDHLYVNPEELVTLRRLADAHGSVERYAAEFRLPDGRQLWLSLNIRALRGADGVITGYEGCFADITAQVGRELSQGRMPELARARFGQGATDAKKPAENLVAGSGGLCPLLSYVCDTLLPRVRQPLDR